MAPSPSTPLLFRSQSQWQAPGKLRSKRLCPSAVSSLRAGTGMLNPGQKESFSLFSLVLVSNTGT